MTLARRSLANAADPAGLLRPEEMAHAEGVRLVADEAQAGQVVLVEPEDGLVRPHVVEDDRVGGVPRTAR